MLPSSRKSSTPVTVTGCAECQLALGNGNDAGEPVPTVESSELRLSEASAVGWAVSATVKVAVPPASVVVSAEVGVTVKPDASSSVVVTDTSLGLIPL